jgi:serine/threonine protein kinase
MQPPPDLIAASGERESSRGALVGGTIIGELYRVIGHLGSGGMADVYEVEHLRLGRHFALKRLRSELARDTSLVERFVREARAVAKLESAHVVAIVDSGIEEGAPYFVMERLHGEELRALLSREGLLPLQRAVHIVLDVCRALTVAHAAGVIHRDLKPENLFITRSELGTDHCKVLDFGVAKLAGENPTMPGTLMGTARYMAPEQISHSTAIAPFTDIFSLGVILYECLSGTTPFAADTLERVLYKILTEPAPPLRELRPEIPEGLADLVQRALAKSGAERPQSAAAFADALSRFTEQRVGSSVSYDSGEDDTLLEVERVPTPPRAQGGAVSKASADRRRAPWLLLSGATFVLGIGIGAAWNRQVREEPSAASSPSTSSSPLPADASLPMPVTSLPPREKSATSASPTLRPNLPATQSTSKSTAASAGATPTPAPSAPPLFFPRDTTK